MASITVKHTFLTYTLGTSLVASQGAPRPQSAPPSSRKAPPGEAVDPPEELFWAQLGQLNDLACGRATLDPMEATRRRGARKSTTSTMAACESEGELEELCEVRTDEGSWMSGPQQATALAAAAPSAQVAQSPRQLDADLQVVLRRIPRDDQGRPTSVGAIGHLESCRPCAFYNSNLGCKFGVLCNFCHFPSGHPEVTKWRFCKGKRERFRKATAGAMAPGLPPQLPGSGGEAHPPLLGYRFNDLENMCSRAAERLSSRARALGEDEFTD